MSTSSASDGTGSTAQLTPGGAGGRRVALAAAGAEGRLDRVGRGEQQRVGALAVAIRHDRHARAPPRPRRSRPATSSGSSSGVSPGTSSTRVEAARQRVADADQRGRRLARLRGVAQHLHALAERRRLGDPIGRDDRHRVEPRHAPQRGQHVGEHRLRQRLSRAGAERGGEALLGRAEALDWEDRDGAHRRPERVGETSARHRPRAALRRREPPKSRIFRASCRMPSMSRISVSVTSRAARRRARPPPSPSSRSP